NKVLAMLNEVLAPMLVKFPDVLLQANYDMLYAEASYLKGNFEEALCYTQQSLGLLEEGGQTQGVIRLNKLKTRIYYALGNISKADSLYRMTESSADSTFSARAYSVDAEIRQKFDS